MNLKNCMNCKKIFAYDGRNKLCPECKKKEEEGFQKVRDYLRLNRGADINEVSEETNVSVAKIVKYLREGKLEVSSGMQDFLKCEKCGESINTGRFCKNCTEKLSNAFGMATSKPKTTENNESIISNKMHIRRK